MLHGRRLVLAATLAGVCISARADEGMWLFNNPPKKLLKDKYGFDATDQWLEHVRKSSVRFNSGGSGSFVSSNGLVMTNHHVGADTLQKISTPEKDYLKNGFYAKTSSEEVKAADLELNVLMEIEDVTERVNAAVKPGMNPAAAQKARRETINEIEKESNDRTKLRSDVVTLYQGGAYHLYRFKKYTDIRLVFAPEKDVAFFGGDPDNFEYPRYDLDICFFRVYENGQPAKVEHYLKWSPAGCKDGELTFVSGHPGRTDRLNTVRHLEYIRDKQMPTQLAVLRRREVLLKTYSDRSLENGRRANEELFSIQNSRKARIGGLGGLQDPIFFGKKREEEKKLREAVAKDPELQKQYGAAWDDVATAVAEGERIAKRFALYERGQAFNSDMYGDARTLVRMNAELKLPNKERLREYGDAGLESLRERLFAETPVYKDLEIVKLADSLSMLIEEFGAEDPMVEKILAGKSPTARAAELVNGTTLDKAAVRKQLAEPNADLAGNGDPMIQLARMVDPVAREIRTTYEQKVDEPMKQAYAKIAQAKFKVEGDSVYPDATFTLRLAFGTVKGYQESTGETVPAMTTLGGTFKHADAHGNVDPFKLPQRWHDAKASLNADTPFNFVSTADIIGGNSGSPVINREGELVGIIFDGNLQSLVLDFAFTDEQARSVSVHSAAIQECLRKVYKATPLADELGR